jgi:ribosomal protein L16 Arg81 hydroxylase
MAADLVIEDFIPDLPQFMQQSFGSQPALYRGAMSKHADLLPTADIVDEILRLDVLPLDYIRLSRSHRTVPRNAHIRFVGDMHQVPLIDRTEVFKAFRSGATLTISGLDKVWPTARTILRPFTQTFACRTDLTLIATPAGFPGFPPHSDPVGVVIVQCEGMKDWRVWPTDMDGPATPTNTDDASLGDTLLQVTLEPGDVLYLPHHTPHTAMASRVQSVHLTAGLHSRGWDDIIARLVSEQLSSSHMTEAPALTEDNTPHLAAELSRRLAGLCDSLRNLDTECALRALRGQLVSELTDDAIGGLGEMHRLDSLSPGQLFQVSRTDFEVLDRSDEHCRVRIDGLVMTVPTIIIENITAEKWQAGREVTCRQIYPGVSEERAMSAAKQLARAEVLRIVPMGS